MLTTYDLYDLFHVYILVRSFPDYPLNRSVLENVLTALKDWEDSINVFRKALMTIEGLDKERFAFVYTQNVYTYIPPLLKDETAYAVLTEATEQLLKAVEGKPISQIRDLADAIHNLPLRIAQAGMKIPRDFCRTELSCYRKKWDKEFLLSQQKKWRFRRG